MQNSHLAFSTCRSMAHVMLFSHISIHQTPDMSLKLNLGGPKLLYRLNWCSISEFAKGTDSLHRSCMSCIWHMWNSKSDEHRDYLEINGILHENPLIQPNLKSPRLLWSTAFCSGIWNDYLSRILIRLKRQVLHHRRSVSISPASAE